MFDGPSYWRFIHYFSLHQSGRDLLQQLGKFIDCKKCQDSYKPPDNTQDLLKWSIDLHNDVNAKLGKHIINPKDCVIKESCDICNSSGIYGDFPWTFIHNVAEACGDEAIYFLKQFQNMYPCENCRNTFLLDDPQSDESCLYWTLRNHKHYNDSRNLPPFIYVMNPPTIDVSTACNGCASYSAT